MLPRIVSIEPSLRSFQYKIRNNILYLNERLYKFNIVDSPLCSLCGAYNKSIKHLFCTCTVTQRLWDQLFRVHEVISFPILESKTVILGLWREKTSNYILINHIILILKRYIFLMRKERKHIRFNKLKAFIKNVENTENQIASRKQKLDIHYKNGTLYCPWCNMHFVKKITWSWATPVSRPGGEKS